MLKTKKTRATAYVALACLLNLAGCGQTGPLYLPPKMALTPTALPSASTLPIIAHVGVS
ncbi:MAG: lipoprotein [Rhodoferax sp.]|jgi:hypothetical protein|nr:lipoprotein [Rhodoferax sp.]